MMCPNRCYRSRTIASLAAAAVLSAPALPVNAWAAPPDDTHYRAGIGFLSKGLNDLAANELETYLRESPDGADEANARYALGVCYARLGRNEDASRELERAMTSPACEFALDAALLRARCAAAVGKDAEAAAMLGTLLKEHPDAAIADRATALRGEALFRAGDLEGAARLLDSVRRRWPASAEGDRAELFCAMAESAIGRVDQAAERAAGLRTRSPEGVYATNAALVEARCRQRMGRLNEASGLYDKAAASRDPAVRDEATLGGAQTARALGDLGRAERLLAELESRDVSEALANGAAIERGRTLYDRSRFADAIGVFERVEVAGLEGAADQAAYWIGRCEIAAGRPSAAAEALGRAAERYPRSPLLPDMQLDRAGALAMAGDDAGAVRLLTRWQETFPSHALLPDAVAARAGALHRLGRFDESLSACQSFVERWPGHARVGAVAMLVVENQFGAGRYEAALDAADRFIAERADDPNAWRVRVRRGMCLGEIGRAEEGAAALREAIADRASAEPDLRRAALGVLAGLEFDSGNWARAERAYSELDESLEGNAGRAECALRLAICIGRQGRAREAVGALGRVESLDQGGELWRRARFERGQALVELGDLDAARADFESVVGASASEGDELASPALRHLAAIASRQGRVADAAAILAKEGGSSADALLRQGAAWMGAGRFDEAERVYAMAMPAPGASGLEARARRAIAINRQGRHEEAINELSAIDDGALDRSLLVPVMYERALALRALGKNQEAAAAYRAVIDDGTVPTLAAYSALDLAQWSISEGNHRQAIELLDRCRAIDSSLGADAEPVAEREVYLRGACLLALGKSDEAISTLAEFRQRFGTSALLPHVGLVLGEAQLKSGRAADAAATLKAVVDAGAPDDVTASALIRLGDAYAAVQRWTDAESAYTANLDRDASAPTWYLARFGQGWCREQQGRHEAAIEAYRDVASRHDGPTAARAQFQIGECLYAMGRHSQAAAELLKVDVLFGHAEWSAAALYEAGRCFADMGRSADAARQFQDVLKRFPDSKWATLAKERIAAASPAPLPGRGASAAGPG